MGNITERIRAYCAKAEFAESLQSMAPHRSEVRKIVSAYINAVATDPKLQRFELATHLAALTKCVRMGLHPGPLNHVYLIPQRGIIDALPSYKGLIARLKRLEGVASVQAHTVHEGDEFSMSAGTKPEIRHEIKLGDRGAFRGVYAIVFYKDQNFQFDYMTASEVNAIKAASKQTGGPWSKWFDQMAKKSIVKRLISFMGFEDPGLGAIEEIDNEEFKENSTAQTVETDSDLGTILDHSSASP